MRMRTVYDPLYLAYHLIKTDYRQMARFVTYTSKKLETSRLRVIADCLASSWRYEMSPSDYFQLRIFEKDRTERARWAGTTFMYKAQSRLNTDGVKGIFRNKERFARRFGQFMDHRRVTLPSPLEVDRLTDWLTEEEITRFVTKPSSGQCGIDVEVHDVEWEGGEPLIGGMSPLRFLEERTGARIAEAWIENHEALRRINPSCLNTLRLVTHAPPGGEVTVMAARMRFGRGGAVDNLAAGGIAAPVDLHTGVISGPAVSSSPLEGIFFESHPISGEPIVGSRVPHWEASLRLATAAAAVLPGARSIGWDIAITREGPLLLEGNDNWCKILWQLPVGTGLRTELEQYLTAEAGG